MSDCKTIGCGDQALPAEDFCGHCMRILDAATRRAQNRSSAGEEVESLTQKYPAYYKDVSHLDEIDVYAVHHIFNIQDPSGALQHASKKILLSGARTGGKSAFKDIKEARDTLTRWLQLNPEPA